MYETFHKFIDYIFTKQWYKSIFYIFIILIFFINPITASQFVNGYFEEGLTGWNTNITNYGGSPHIQHKAADGLYSGHYIRIGSGLISGTNWVKSFISQDVDLSNYNTLTWLGGKYHKGDTTGYSRLYIDDVIYKECPHTGDAMTLLSVDISELVGVHTIRFELYAYGGTTDFGNIYIAAVRLEDYEEPEGTLYIANNGNNQNWYVNTTLYPNLDVYFEEIVDYQITYFNVSREYYINCTTSNASYPYTYNYFIDDNNGNSYDNSICSREGMKTKILYPDSPTTYTFHLYEISESISDSFPWYYWLLYPLYMLIDMFIDEEDVTVTEIDTIQITLSKISGDNETIPDIPQEPEESYIPPSESAPDEPINWTLPEEPPNYEGGNQTITVTWIDGYYSTVNNTIGSLCSPMYNFTNWSLSPIYSLNSSISDFNGYMNASFTQTTEDSSILYESINTIFNAIPPKVRNVITYYLIWIVLLIILKKK